MELLQSGNIPRIMLEPKGRSVFNGYHESTLFLHTVMDTISFNQSMKLIIQETQKKKKKKKKSVIMPGLSTWPNCSPTYSAVGHLIALP